MPVKLFCYGNRNALDGQGREVYLRTQAGIRVLELDLHVGERAEFLHHRKADARSARLARHLVFDAVEFLEDLRHFGLRDARAVVAHGEVEVRVLEAQLDVDHLVVRVLRELERVVHEVHQYLHDGVAVHHQRDVLDVGIGRYGELEALLLDVLAVGRDKVVEHSLRPVAAQLHVPAVAVELGEIQHVLDESREALRLACDLVVVLLALLLVGHPGVLQKFRVHADGGQRRLEFVTYRRDEILALGGERELALREPVDADEAAGQHDEHGDAQEQEDAATRGAFLLRDVHVQGNVSEGGRQRRRQQQRRGLVPVAVGEERPVLVHELDDKVLFLRVELDFVRDEVREVGAQFHDEALHEYLGAALHVSVEDDVRVVEGRLEGLDFHFHHVRRVDVGAQQAEGVHLGRFHVERERFLFGSLFKTLFPLEVGLFLALAVEPEILLVDLVEHGFDGIAGLRPDVAYFANPEVLLHEDGLELVEHRLALVAVGHRDLLEDAVGEDGGAQRAVGVHLEMPDDTLDVAPQGEVRQFGKRDFLAADHGHGADEAVFGIRPLVLDGHVVRKTLVEHLQNQEGVFLVGVLRVKLQLLIRMGQENDDRYRNCNEYRNEY